MARVTVNEDLCKGCGLCARACPKKIMALSKTRFNARGYRPAEVSDMAQCVGCASCAMTCPDTAITVER